MADVEHRNLTGNALHEPKGVETASADDVYVADGAGSGNWTNRFADLNNTNLISLFTRIPDISTASSVFVVSPLQGNVAAVYVVLHGAITVADSIVTAEIGGVPIGGISITCAQTGSAPGSTFSDTSTTNTLVTAGQAVEIITDGASTGTVAAEVTVLVDVS